MSIPHLFTAMITPFDDKLEINYDKAAELADYLVKNGSDGIVVSGTTGESPVLSNAEKLQLFKVVRDSVGKRAQVWAGTGSYDTKATIALNKEVEKLDMDGLLLVTPYYNKPTQEGLFLHYKAIAENTTLPIMLYNVPGRSATHLEAETVARICQFDNVVAIKEAGGSVDQVSQLKRVLPDNIRVYSGDDSLTLPMMAVGAIGVVSVVSHIVGKEIKAMINAFISGDVKQAQKLHNDLYPLFKGLFMCTNPIPVKEALNLMGMNVGGFRLPLCNANAGQIEQLKNLLKQYDLVP